MTYYETPEPQRKRALMNYHKAKPPTRLERREQTRQAVEALLLKHSVKQMVQVAFEANGGKGDAGARVLR